VRGVETFLLLVALGLLLLEAVLDLLEVPHARLNFLAVGLSALVGELLYAHLQ